MKQKFVSGKKYRQYIADNNLNSAKVCRKAGIHHSYGMNSTGTATNGGQNEKCSVNEVYWNLICDVLGVAKDYFDVKEEPEPVKVPEPEEEKPECLVDLADIQLSVNKVEGLLLKTVALLKENNALLEENNRLLRGKIEKGERSNDTKGITNSGAAHSYTVSSVRALR